MAEANPTRDPELSVADAAIEMPQPTAWPMVLSLGLMLAGFGIAISALLFTALGGTLVVISLWHWFAILVTGTGIEAEPMTGPRPSPIEGRTGTVEKLKPSGYRARLPSRIYPVAAGLKGGLAGGLVMPIPAITWSLVAGHGLWYPVNLLAGMVIPGIDKLSVPELEQFRAIMFVIGVVIHVAMSAVIGLMYGVLLPLSPGRASWHLVFGGILIPLGWTGMSVSLMGLANPVLRQHVNWYWFGVSQVVFGLAAATVVVRSEKVEVPPAGTGNNGPERGQT